MNVLKHCQNARHCLHNCSCSLYTLLLLLLLLFLLHLLLKRCSPLWTLASSVPDRLWLLPDCFPSYYIMPQSWFKASVQLWIWLFYFLNKLFFTGLGRSSNMMDERFSLCLWTHSWPVRPGRPCQRSSSNQLCIITEYKINSIIASALYLCQNPSTFRNAG